MNRLKRKISFPFLSSLILLSTGSLAGALDTTSQTSDLDKISQPSNLGRSFLDPSSTQFDPTQSMIFASEQSLEISKLERNVQSLRADRNEAMNKLIAKSKEVYGLINESGLISTYLTKDQRQKKNISELLKEVNDLSKYAEDEHNIIRWMGDNFPDQVKQAVSLSALAYDPSRTSFKPEEIAAFSTKVSDKIASLEGYLAQIKEILNEIAGVQKQGIFANFFGTNAPKSYEEIYDQIVQLQQKLNLTTYGFGAQDSLPSVANLKSILGRKNVSGLEEAMQKNIKDHKIREQLEQYPEYLSRQIELLQRLLQMKDGGHLDELYYCLRSNLYSSDDQIVHVFTRNNKEFSGWASFKASDNGDHQLRLTFAGTDSLADLLKDLQGWNQIAPASKGFLTGIKLHSGFAQIFNETLDQFSLSMQDWVKHFKRQYASSGGKLRIIATGHSLGGTLANLYAAALSQILKEQGLEFEIGVISIAAPNFIHASSVDLFEELLPGNRIFSINHKFDLIPKAIVWKTKPKGIEMTSNEFFWSDAGGALKLAADPGHHSIENYSADVTVSFNKWYLAWQNAQSSLKTIKAELEALEKEESHFKNHYEELLFAAEMNLHEEKSSPVNNRIADRLSDKKLKKVSEDCIVNMLTSVESNAGLMVELTELARKSDEKFAHAVEKTKRYSRLNPLAYLPSWQVPANKFKDERSLGLLSTNWAKLFRDNDGKKLRHLSHHFGPMTNLESHPESATLQAVLASLSMQAKIVNRVKKETALLSDVNSVEELSQALVSQIKWYSNKKVSDLRMANTFKTSLELFKEFILAVDDKSKHMRNYNGSLLLTSSDIILYQLDKSLNKIKLAMAQDPKRFQTWAPLIKNEAKALLNSIEFSKESFAIISMLDHYFWGTLGLNNAANPAQLELLSSAKHMESPTDSYLDGVVARMNDFINLCEILKLHDVKGLADLLIGRNKTLIKHYRELAE